MTTSNKPAICEDCGEKIQIIATKKDNKPIPCNVAPITIVTRKGEIVQGFAAHRATCESAKRFRKEGTNDGK